jgi:hypothetical protein
VRSTHRGTGSDEILDEGHFIVLEVLVTELSKDKENALRLAQVNEKLMDMISIILLYRLVASVKAVSISTGTKIACSNG